jgi:hypothetical protein
VGIRPPKGQKPWPQLDGDEVGTYSTTRYITISLCSAVLSYPLSHLVQPYRYAAIK